MNTIKTRKGSIDPCSAAQSHNKVSTLRVYSVSVLMPVATLPPLDPPYMAAGTAYTSCIKD